MTRIQQSVEVKVPAYMVYDQLMRFEDYPHFMEGVEQVRQLDDRHLRWTIRWEDSGVEWVTELIGKEPYRCIAWRTPAGQNCESRVDMQPAGVDASRVTVTLESDHEPKSVLTDKVSDAELARRLATSLTSFKKFIETDHEQKKSKGTPIASFAAGSEGFAGDEDPTAPVTSAAHLAAEIRNDSAGSSNPFPHSVRSFRDATSRSPSDVSAEMPDNAAPARAADNTSAEKRK